MKQIISLLFAILFAVNVSNAQNNVRLSPQTDTVCYGTKLSLWIAGQSFTPLSYDWSNGATTPTINITSSGTYSVHVMGYLGSSYSLRSYVLTRTYVVKDIPKIDVMKGPWVCKMDTVVLSAEDGYTTYRWNNNTTSKTFTRQMVGSGGGPILDTVSVWYTASMGSTCTVNSDTLVIRGIRRPNGVGVNFCGKMDIKDSVPAGLVLRYIYPVQYEMEFTQINNPTNIVTYVTPITTNKAPLNILIPGETYYVRTRPIINNITYCWGDTCIIGVRATSNRFSAEYLNEPKKFSIFNIEGRLITEKEGYSFDDNWLKELPRELYVVVQYNSDNTVEVTKKFMTE